MDSVKEVTKQEDFLKEEFDVSGVGPHLKKHGVTRSKLLDGNCDCEPLSQDTLGDFQDLDSFRKQENASYKDLSVWWKLNRPGHRC